MEYAGEVFFVSEIYYYSVDWLESDAVFAQNYDLVDGIVLEVAPG